MSTVNRIIFLNIIMTWNLQLISGQPISYRSLLAPPPRTHQKGTNTLYFKVDTGTMTFTNLSIYDLSDDKLAATSMAGMFCQNFHALGADIAASKSHKEGEVEDGVFFPSLPWRNSNEIVGGRLNEVNPCGDHLIWQEKLKGNLFVTNYRTNSSFILIPSLKKLDLFTFDWNNGIIFLVATDSKRAVVKIKIPKPNLMHMIYNHTYEPSPILYDFIRGLACQGDVNETVYWLDRSYLYRGTTRGVTELYSSFTQAVSYGSLQYCEGFLYWFQGWSVGQTKSLITYDIVKGMFSTKNIDFKDRQLDRLFIYEDKREVVESGCEQLNCSHICIPSYKAQFQCVCPWGLKLVDGRRCIGTEIYSLSTIAASSRSSDVQLSWYDLGVRSIESRNFNCLEGTPSFLQKKYFTWILTTAYFEINEARCTANLSSNFRSAESSYSLILPLKSVPVYGSILEENIHFFVNDTGCLRRLDLSTSIWWTVTCLLGLGRGQSALDVDRWILFWEDEHKSGFQTDLMTNKTRPFTLFKSAIRRGPEPSNLVALDSHDMQVYLLSLGFLNVTSYNDSVQTVACLVDGDRVSNLIFSAGRLFWLEHFDASSKDNVVTFDPKYKKKENLFASKFLVGFKVLLKKVKQGTGCPENQCSHFCVSVVPGEFKCFCPPELPILVNASTCTLPQVLIATADRINAEKMELTVVNSNPEVVTAFNFSLELHDIHYAVLKSRNNSIVCKAVPRFKSRRQIQCNVSSSHDTVFIGHRNDSEQIMTIGAREEILFSQSISDGCIHLYFFRLNASLKSICVSLQANVPFVIDTRRHVLFWCQGDTLNYNELRARDNTAKSLTPDTWSGDCQDLAVNEYKAELFIIISNSIILVEYSKFLLPEKEQTELHQMAYDYYEGLQYYENNVFWIGGLSQPGEFIDSFAIRRNTWGKAVVGSFNFQRIYNSERAEQILRFQIFESSSEEEDWTSPCDAEPRKCDAFCLIGDPLPPKQNHSATCLPLEVHEDILSSTAETDSETIAGGTLFETSETDVALENYQWVIIISAFMAGCLMLAVIGAIIYLRSRDSESVALAFLTTVIPPDQIQWDTSKVVGRGNFGIVYFGRYNDMDVAVKTTKCTDNPQLNENLLADFIQELKVMAQIKHHNHVVMFYGAEISAISDGKVYAVLEFSPIGSLKTHLQNLGGKGEYIEVEENEEDVDNDENGRACKMMLSWTRQIASGMLHLENKNIVHGDLATRNILVFDEGRTVKLTDFGLSKNLQNSEYYTKILNRPMPFRWSAIEILEKREFSTKADVWSYGVTVWEIFTLGALPYAECEWDSEFVTKLKDGMRLPKPNRDVCQAYEKIMLPCWAIRGRDRPSFSSIELACLGIFKEEQDYLCMQSESGYEEIQTGTLKNLFLLGECLHCGIYHSMYEMPFSGMELL